MIKIRDDVVEWFEAQCLDGEGSALNPPLSNGVHFVGSVSENLWIKPPANWVKCNIGASW